MTPVFFVMRRICELRVYCMHRVRNLYYSSLVLVFSDSVVDSAYRRFISEVLVFILHNEVLVMDDGFLATHSTPFGGSSDGRFNLLLSYLLY